MDDVINKALRGQPAGEVLVEGYRLQITRGDIATLAGLNWLNDEVGYTCNLCLFSFTSTLIRFI